MDRRTQYNVMMIAAVFLIIAWFLVFTKEEILEKPKTRKVIGIANG